MKKQFLNLSVLLVLILASGRQSSAQTDSLENKTFSFIIGKSLLNKSLWSQPYRFEDKSLKSLSVQLIIEKKNGKNELLDFDQFFLVDETRSLRIRPSAVYYYKGERKIYLRSKAVNKNYNAFKESNLENYTNFEAETFKPNILGRKRKKAKSSVKSLKKITVKAKKITYHLDFPVHEGYTYGKVYYEFRPIGFASVQK